VGPNTEVVDLNGRLAIPGFIEGHGHFMGLGRSKMILELADVKNFDEIVAMVRDAVAAAQPGEWIMGRGWHQEKWDKVPQPNVEGVPLHTALDSISPNNPVLLTHASGHAAFANGAALRAAGVDRRTPNPRGGELVKDGGGNPTGLLRETAQGLVNTTTFNADYVIAPVAGLNLRAFFRRYDLRNETPVSQWQYVTSDTSNLNGTVSYKNKRVSLPYAWDRLNAGVGAIAIGPVALDATAATTFGADHVVIVADDHAALYQPHLYVRAVAERVKAKDYSVVLLSATALGKDLGPRLAARLGWPLAAGLGKSGGRSLPSTATALSVGAASSRLSRTAGDGLYREYSASLGASSSRNRRIASPSSTVGAARRK